MEIIRGKNNGDVYTISFLITLATMFLGPLIFLLPMMLILIKNDPNFSFTAEYLLGLEFIKANMIIEFISDIIPIALLIVIFRKVLQIDFRNFKEKLLKNILVIIGGFVAIIILAEFLSWLYEMLGIEGEASNQSMIEIALRSNVRPFMFIMIVFFAPFFEEMLFRKFFIGSLVEKFSLNKWIAFAISAFVFAAVHVLGDPSSWIFIFQYLALSIVITLSYIITNYNIYVPMGVHFLNNLLSFIIV